MHSATKMTIAGNRSESRKLMAPKMPAGIPTTHSASAIHPVIRFSSALGETVKRYTSTKMSAAIGTVSMPIIMRVSLAIRQVRGIKLYAD